MSGAITAAATRTAADERGRTLQTSPTKSRLRKIATEEAFIIPEIASAVRDVVRQGGPNLDLKLLRLIYDAPADNGANPAAAAGFATRWPARSCPAFSISVRGDSRRWMQMAWTCTFSH
jgi:hypothetical protein